MADLNNITPMKGLPPFLQYFRTIGIIPTSYKVTLTFEEQILELMHFIKTEIIPKINENVLATTELQEKFKELVIYVDKYFENLDLQTQIDQKLNEMVEDGTLEEIINQGIFGELDARVTENTSKIDFVKKFPTTKIGLNRTFRFIDDSVYRSMQGGALTLNNTLICALWNETNDTNKLLEISLANGQILKQAEFNFGYANSLCFDNVHKLIYIAHRGSTAEPNQKKVSIVNYTNFSLVNTITFTDYVMSTSYDKTTNKLYFMNEWGLRNSYGFKVYEINQSSYIIEKTINLDFSSKDVKKLKIQDFCVVENYIYIISSEPRALLVFDIEGNLLQKYNLPEYINKIFYSGEYEFIDYVNNNLFIGSADNVSGNIESINQLFKITLDEDFIDGNENETTVHAGSSYIVYVDASSTSVNPDGSSNNKFKSINEATRCETTNRGCNIYIADGTYNGVYLRSRDHITFDGNSQNVIIKGFNINYCSHVVINNATINDCQFDQNGVINILNSNVYLKALNIQDSNNLYGIYIGEFSMCNLSVSMSITTNNDNQIYIRNDSLLINNHAYWKIQKHQKASKIIGEGRIRMFAEPSNMSVGEFTIDSSWAYTEYKFYNFFNYMLIRYIVDNKEYIEKVPLYSSSNDGTLEFTHVSGSAGTQKTSQVYYSIDTTNAKFKLQYSRVYTRKANGVCTVEENEDNDNPIDDAIIIDDIYFE